jgi:hypothetical protein
LNQTNIESRSFKPKQSLQPNRREHRENSSQELQENLIETPLFWLKESLSSQEKEKEKESSTITEALHA